MLHEMRGSIVEDARCRPTHAWWDGYFSEPGIGGCRDKRERVETRVSLVDSRDIGDCTDDKRVIIIDLVLLPLDVVLALVAGETVRDAQPKQTTKAPARTSHTQLHLLAATTTLAPSTQIIQFAC